MSGYHIISLPPSLFSPRSWLTRYRAAGGRTRSPGDDGEVGGGSGGGGDENGGEEEGSESRAAGETVSAARWERRASAAPTPATTQHTPPMPGGPSRAAVADDDDELSRLLSLAKANLDAGHLCAARLDPDSPRGSLLLTVVSVLVADHSSHRATLLAIASGVALDEGGGERGGVNGARDNGPWGRREGGLGRRRQRAVGGR
uniref:Uncharacterized protein n=1 Tax=Oryza rufipogon TaxID=4529 RepID=A0A0E0PLV7_ORYRU